MFRFAIIHALWLFKFTSTIRVFSFDWSCISQGRCISLIVAVWRCWNVTTFKKETKSSQNQSNYFNITTYFYSLLISS